MPDQPTPTPPEPSAEAQRLTRDGDEHAEATAAHVRQMATMHVTEVLTRHFPGPGTDYAIRRAARLAVGIAERREDPVGDLIAGVSDDEHGEQMRSGALHALSPAPFGFTTDYDEAADDGSRLGTLSWQTCVYEAVGAASVCWTTMEGAGVFREDRAREIAEAILDRSGLPRDARVRP